MLVIIYAYGKALRLSDANSANANRRHPLRLVVESYLDPPPA